MPEPSERILIVEDEEEFRKLVVDQLKSVGYEVQSAPHGADALKTLESFIPDVIVADVAMPVMDGFEFCKRVREHNEWIDIPFIFLSAHGDKLQMRAGMDVGADEYLAKPIDLDDLLFAIRSRLERVREVRRKYNSEIEAIKDDLFVYLPHELRTPLNAIKGFTELLVKKPSELPPERKQELLFRVRSGYNRLERILENILLLQELQSINARPEKLGETVKPAILDWKALVSDIIEQYKPLADRKEVTLWTDLRGGHYQFAVRHKFFRALLVELLDNAIKFTSAGGSVRVYVVGTKEGMEIRVCDSGPGIPPEMRERIFTTFYQHDRKTIEQQGLGLGLALVKKTVDLYKGSIVVGEWKGGGSEIRINLT